MERKKKCISECSKKSNPTERNVSISVDFKKKLTTELDSQAAFMENGNRGNVEAVIQAKVQANSLVACCRLAGKSDLIVLKYLDFCTLVGPNNV